MKIARKYSTIIGTPSSAIVTGSPDGVITAAITAMTTSAMRQLFSSRCGDTAFTRTEPDDEDRQQESDAEREDHQTDEGDVARHREDLVDVRTRPRDQELERLADA